MTVEDSAFDPKEIETILSEALTPTEDPPSDSGEPIRTLLSLGDTTLLKNLATILSDKLEPGDISDVLGQLRSELSAGEQSKDILHIHRKAQALGTDVTLPYWNVKDPEVMFLSQNPPYGEDEVSMFVGALSEAGFESRHCVWDFVQKDSNEETLDRWINLCFSEIRIWQPKLIVTMGLPAWMSLGLDVKPPKLGDIAGRIFWFGPWSVMPTSSPGHVIQSNRRDSFVSNLRSAHNFVFGS